MKTYYYSDGTTQFGPFDMDVLKTKSITKDTLMWYEGMKNWKKAGEIPELNDLFKSVPPPLNNQSEVQSVLPPKLEPKIDSSKKSVDATKRKKRIRNIVLFSLLGVFVVVVGVRVVIFIQNQNSASPSETSYTSWNADKPSDNNESAECEDGACEGGECEGGESNDKNSSSNHEKSTEELEEDLRKKEENKPLEYLWVNYDIKYKVLSGKDEISGHIFNDATLGNFKDIVLTVTCYSNTDFKLSSDDYVIYDYVFANGSIPYKISMSSPKGTKKIGVTVKSASPY